jgi:hypothetical protein
MAFGKHEGGLPVLAGANCSALRSCTAAYLYPPSPIIDENDPVITRYAKLTAKEHPPGRPVASDLGNPVPGKVAPLSFERLCCEANSLDLS